MFVYGGNQLHTALQYVSLPHTVEQVSKCPALPTILLSNARVPPSLMRRPSKVEIVV